MGICRDGTNQEIDIVKEMAEGLGSSGLRVEEALEKTLSARRKVEDLLKRYYNGRSDPDKPDLTAVNESIRTYNGLVDRAQDALRWLLIQREACGFRTHRNVHFFYPIPAKIKLLKA
jgi:hypothetical protein